MGTTASAETVKEELSKVDVRTPDTVDDDQDVISPIIAPIIEKPNNIIDSRDSMDDTEDEEDDDDDDTEPETESALTEPPKKKQKIEKMDRISKIDKIEK